MEFEALDCERGALPAPLRARVYGGPLHLGRGDRLKVIAQLAPVRLFRNQGLPDPLPRASRAEVVLSGSLLAATFVSRGRGWKALVDEARFYARGRLEHAFSPLVAPMARALVLGENDLEEADDEAFRNSGLAHLLAVSGTHLVFAVVSVLGMLRGALVRVEVLAARFDVSRLVAMLGVPMALLYADYAGGSGSAWRAAWMLAFLFAVRLVGRRPDGVLALGASLAIGAIADPLALFDLSFLLSAAATAGLLWMGRPWLGRLVPVRSSMLRYLLGSVLATTSAMLPCAPLLALMCPTITLAGLLANVIAAPLGEIVALPLCLSHAWLGPFPALDQGVALVASGALGAVREIALASASIEWLAMSVPDPSAWQLALLGVALALIPSMERLKLRAAVAALSLLGLVALEVSLRTNDVPAGLLRVSVLDVGQGDCLLVDFPDGRLMLVDGGGFVGSPVDTGKSVVLPMLRARRRNRIDVAVLTHPHPDHYGGLLSALPELEVGELWAVSGLSHGPLGKVAAELAARGTLLRTAKQLCQRATAFGTAYVSVLAPCSDSVGSRHANDHSLVLRLELGDYAALLVGDAEQAEEQELLRSHAGRLGADFLKAGHHGSRTSSSRSFVLAVAPRFAAISSGVRNRFGHPHAVTLATFRATGTRSLRTDRQGSVTWSTDGLRSRISYFSEPR